MVIEITTDSTIISKILPLCKEEKGEATKIMIEDLTTILQDLNVLIIMIVMVKSKMILVQGEQEIIKGTKLIDLPEAEIILKKIKIMIRKFEEFLSLPLILMKKKEVIFR